MPQTIQTLPQLTKTVTVVAIADPQEPIVDEGEGTDTVAPDVNISVPTVPQNGAFEVRIIFTETVSDFESSMTLSLGGTATASTSQAWDMTDNTVYHCHRSHRRRVGK